MNILMLFLIVILLIFGSIGFYRYYEVMRENKILKQKYQEPQQQVDEKERIIEQLKNGETSGR